MRFRGISKFLIRMPKKLDAEFHKEGLILQCKKARLDRNILGISDLCTFRQKRGNDLATVINSAICSVFLSNNSYFDAKVAHFLVNPSKLPNKNLYLCNHETKDFKLDRSQLGKRIRT